MLPEPAAIVRLFCSVEDDESAASKVTALFVVVSVVAVPAVTAPRKRCAPAEVSVAVSMRVVPVTSSEARPVMASVVLLESPRMALPTTFNANLFVPSSPRTVLRKETTLPVSVVAARSSTAFE